MIQDIISVCSIICVLKEIVKKSEKLDHHENYRMYGNRFATT